MINLDSILKSRDITLPTKVHIVKAMVFTVVMYGCESWTIKKAEHQRSDAFELWWRRLLRRDFKEIKPVNHKGNQSWRFIGRTDAEAEAPILWSSDAKNWLIGKDPDAGQDWRQEEKGVTGWDGWMASPTWWTWVWAGFGSWSRTGKPGMLWSMGMGKSQTWLSNWTKLNLGVSKGHTATWDTTLKRKGTDWELPAPPRRAGSRRLSRLQAQGLESVSFGTWRQTEAWVAAARWPRPFGISSHAVVGWNSGSRGVTAVTFPKKNIS